MNAGDAAWPATALRDALGGDATRDAWHLVELGSVGSTQDKALHIVHEIGSLRDRWLVVRAEHQVAGRGRGGKAWLDAPGASLLVTVAAELPAPAERWPLASLVAGAALAAALRESTGATVAMKWPNDLLLVHDGAWRKLGGCLAEHRERSGAAPVWLFGFGVNLERGGFPASIADDLAFVSDTRPLGQPSSLAAPDLLARLLLAVRVSMRRWQARGFRLDLEALQAQLAFVGCEVTLALDDRGATTSGHLLGIDDDGRLRLGDATGRERAWLPISVLDAKSSPPWHAPAPRMRT